jgi:hypothetical protein
MRQSANRIADDQRRMNNNFLKLRRGFDAAMRSKINVAPNERPLA